jgi:hypothetical protein
MADDGKPKIGRPAELTEALIVQATALVRDTHFVSTAASLLGISRETFYKWAERGSRERRRRDRGKEPRPDEELYLAFSDTVKKALAEGERYHIENIKKASSNSWQASAWVLERRHPQRWSLERNELRKLRKVVRRLVEERETGITKPMGVEDEV